MSEGQYCRVHIRVVARTSIGQTVAVGGSCKAMGNFDKCRVIHLVTTPDSFPVWFTKNPIILPRYQVSQYKYCTVEGGIVRSFERVENMRMIKPESMDTFVEDVFNPLRLEASGLDTEDSLLQEMRRLTSQTSSPTLDGSVQFSGKQIAQKLFFVCYHLPVVIKRTGDSSRPFEVMWAESLLAKTGNSVSEDTPVVWLGTCQVPDPKPSADELTFLLASLSKMNCFPIILDHALASLAYNGYCKHILWPVFHNVDQLDQIHSAWNVEGSTSDDALFRSHSKSVDGPKPSQAVLLADEQELRWTMNEVEFYAAYNEVSRIFDEHLSALIKPGDVVWVHDYHLMLLPKMIRDRAIENVRIVFFLHIPFPTSQIFRSLGSASDLLQSVTSSDIIGFHAFDHTRHFLNATKRILGIGSTTLQGGLLSLNVQDRSAIVTMSHVSIEPEVLDAVLLNQDVLDAAEQIKKDHHGRRIILGIDACQRLSGGALKLAAFEKLLNDNGGGKVVLIQRCLRPGSRKGDEETTSSDLRKMVAELNLRYNKEGDDVVVDYMELPSMSLRQRVALYLAADVFCLTSIREGLNLMPLEYMYARRDMAHAGVVVASEFSTCSSLLSGSLKINPFYTLSVADALDKALNMSKEECKIRNLRDIKFIASHPSSEWTRQIIGDMKHLDATRSKKQSTARKANLPELLDLEFIVDAYETARDVGLTCKGTRVFIFDYDGTLLEKGKMEIYMKNAVSSMASNFQPNKRMMDAIRSLSEDPHNVVVVISGLTRNKLGDTFRGYKNLTLVTSNGLVYSWGENMLNSDERILQELRRRDSRVPTSTEADEHSSMQIDEEGRVWYYLDFQVDWKAVCQIALPIIEKYTYRTNGACVSARSPGVGWSYFGADPDWGEKQAAQLTVDLEAALANYDVKIESQHQGSIEVIPTSLTKGSMVRVVYDRILSFRAGSLPAFSLVIGAEANDDYMFDAFYELLAGSPNASTCKNLRGFTVCVGSRPGTSAALYCNDVNHVEDVITSIASSHAQTHGLNGTLPEAGEPIESVVRIPADA